MSEERAVPVKPERLVEMSIVTAAIPVAPPLEAVRDEWVAIYEELPVKSPFLAFEYLCLWYHCFAEAEDIRIIRVADQGETLGFLPMVHSRRAGIRILKSRTNAHCFHSAPLIRADRGEQFARQLYATLQADQSSWDVLELACFVSSRSDFNIVSPERLAGSGFVFASTEQPNFSIDLAGTFEEYYNSTLTSKLRTNIRSRRNRLQTAGGGTYRHYQGTAAVAHFDEFLQLENSGWKGSAGSSIMSLPDSYQHYYRHLVNFLANQDSLHLFFLDLGDKPIAGAFGYTEDEVFHWFKIGYREEYGEMAPLNLLLLDNIKYFMENRRDIRRFNMFPEDGGYKHRWVNENTTMVGVALFSGTLMGRAAHSISRIRNRLKRIPWFLQLVKHIRAVI
jgi:CelD/BcsL family acetyltransferase involved in cellulose biosynthesis